MVRIPRLRTASWKDSGELRFSGTRCRATFPSRLLLGPVLALGLSLVGCSNSALNSDSDESNEGNPSSSGSHSSSGRPYINPNGPLVFLSGSGTQLLAEPKQHGDWYGSFGSFMPCLADESVPATITGVKYVIRVAPVSIETWIRRIPPATERQDPKDLAWSPILMLDGAVDELGLKGSLTQELPVTVTESCEEALQDLGRQRETIEFLTEMKISPRGADVPVTIFDYEVDGYPYSVRVNMRNGGCGTVVAPSGC